MTTYLLLDGQLRAETDAEVIANLKRKGWTDAPAKPSEDAQWTDGAWVVPPVPTYTPEAWTSQHFSPMQVSALQRFEFALMQAGKPLGPLMTALKAWLEGMLIASVDPTPRTFSAPPCSYEAASAEAVQSLSQ
jgi:hypothetical protein